MHTGSRSRGWATPRVGALATAGERTSRGCNEATDSFASPATPPCDGRRETTRSVPAARRTAVQRRHLLPAGRLACPERGPHTSYERRQGRHQHRHSYSPHLALLLLLLVGLELLQRHTGVVQLAQLLREGGRGAGWSREVEGAQGCLAAGPPVARCMPTAPLRSAPPRKPFRSSQDTTASKLSVDCLSLACTRLASSFLLPDTGALRAASSARSSRTPMRDTASTAPVAASTQHSDCGSTATPSMNRQERGPGTAAAASVAASCSACATLGAAGSAADGSTRGEGGGAELRGGLRAHASEPDDGPTGSKAARASARTSSAPTVLLLPLLLPLPLLLQAIPLQDPRAGPRR